MKKQIKTSEISKEQMLFLEDCLKLHEKMYGGHEPSEFEVLSLMVNLGECGDIALGNRTGIETCIKNYIAGREYERKQLFANLTAVIGFNMPYRKNEYFIDKKYNESFVDLTMAKKFVDNNKLNWGFEYELPYKKKTPLESTIDILEDYIEKFKETISEDYVRRMNMLKSAPKIEERVSKGEFDVDYMNIRDGKIRMETIILCQKEESIRWDPKYIQADEDFVVIMDNATETILGCGNIKRDIDRINKDITTFKIKEVEFHFPGAYASMINSLVNFDKNIKIEGKLSRNTESFWKRMNAEIDEYGNFELTGDRFKRTKYHQENEIQ